MDDKERIDFGPLDPTRDPGWDDRVQAIAARAARARRDEAGGGWLALLAWWRPALSIAAALALVVWIGVFVRDRTPVQARRADPALIVLEWSLSGETPAVGELLGAAGGEHDD
jgi:hypothetical protein